MIEINAPRHFDATENRVMKRLNFGVEIELACINTSDMARVLASVLGRRSEYVRSHQGYSSLAVRDDQGRAWFAMTDCSIRCPYGKGAELVTPPLSYSDIPLLQEILRRLRSAGARSNQSCGIHIHVGLDRQDGEQMINIDSLKRCVKNTSKYENLMTLALQIGERRQDEYCKPIDRRIVDGIDRVKNLDDLNKLVFNRETVQTPSMIGRYPSQRYTGMNLVNVWRIGTVEGRWFNGTTNAGTLRAYISLMLAIAEKSIITRRASSAQRVIAAGNEKYAVRTWLIELGLKGDEFKTVRKKLTAHLAGDAARVGSRAA